MRMGPHRLVCHMWGIGAIGLGRAHRDGAHLGRRRVRSGQRWAAVGLGRVRERRHRACLVGRMVLGVHTTPGLVGSAEAGTRRVGHLALIIRLRVSAATATLMVITTTTGATAHVVTHVAVCRLGRFASQMCRLRTGPKGGLRRASLLVGRLLLIPKLSRYAKRKIDPGISPAFQAQLA